MLIIGFFPWKYFLEDILPFQINRLTVFNSHIHTGDPPYYFFHVPYYTSEKYIFFSEVTAFQFFFAN